MAVDGTSFDETENAKYVLIGFQQMHSATNEIKASFHFLKAIHRTRYAKLMTRMMGKPNPR